MSEPVGILNAEASGLHVFADPPLAEPAAQPHRWTLVGVFDLTVNEAKRVAQGAAAAEMWLPGDGPTDRPPMRNDNLRQEGMFVGCFACEQTYSDEIAETPCPGMKVPQIQFGARPGRNDKCPCGSGRKYKRCHGAAEVDA